MKPRGASMADYPSGESEDGRRFPGEGRQNLVADEVDASMDGTQPAVLDPTRDLVRRDATRDELPTCHAALLSIG